MEKLTREEIEVFELLMISKCDDPGRASMVSHICSLALHDLSTLAPSAPTEREIREQAINGAWCAKEMHEAWMKQQLEKAVELLPKDSPALPAIYGAMYVDTRPLSRKEWEYGLELAAFLPPAPAAEKE